MLCTLQMMTKKVIGADAIHNFSDVPCIHICIFAVVCYEFVDEAKSQKYKSHGPSWSQEKAEIDIF